MQLILRILEEGGRKGRPGSMCREIAVCPGKDGEDRNDSREVLIRTSHTTQKRIWAILGAWRDKKSPFRG